MTYSWEVIILKLTLRLAHFGDLQGEAEKKASLKSAARGAVRHRKKEKTRERCKITAQKKRKTRGNQMRKSWVGKKERDKEKRNL